MNFALNNCTNPYHAFQYPIVPISRCPGPFQRILGMCLPSSVVWKIDLYMFMPLAYIFTIFLHVLELPHHCVAVSQVASSSMFWRRSQSRQKPTSREFPASIEGFGYHFNDNGQLRSIETNGPFQFEVKAGNHRHNQLHYEALGKAVEEHIYHLLVTQEGLEKVIVPIDAIEKEAKSFIFMSPDIEKYDRMLILINGAEPVRAGQWSRSLIINHSLESGSQIPYIREAKKNGYGVVILNTNQNSDIESGKGTVRGSESPEDHFVYVWDKIINVKKVKDIAIMAHSYGGVVVVNCALKRLGEVKDKVFAVAMSDSVHGSMPIPKSPEVKYFQDWFKERSMNWVSSPLPLDTHVDSPNRIDSRRVSAGTKRHVETSWKAFSSVFKFFEEKLDQRLGARSRQGQWKSAPNSPVVENVACSLLQMSKSLPQPLERSPEPGQLDLRDEEQEPTQLYDDTEPMSQEPLSQGPLSQGPLSQGPLSQGSLSQEPLSQEPLSQEPLSQEPLSQDPLSQDPSSPGAVESMDMTEPEVCATQSRGNREPVENDDSTLPCKN